MIETNDLLAKLTEPQREAVMHTDGPLLVLAGPGSGKTRVITHRVAYLINEAAPARQMLAITFTNKAAEEMRQRLAALRVPRGSTICTFHSLAARLLREFSDIIGIPSNFSIYDDSDQLTTIRGAIKSLELDSQNFPPGKMLNQISACKNDLETPEQFADRKNDFRGKKIARIYAVYQKQLAANGALDFDDLLMKLAFLLRDFPDIRDQLNDRYRYVLVDEYQDTNHSQYQIARGLAINHNNLCVTGDPDQSIYGWRGADIGNILAFEEDYPDALVIRLEENFRSTPEILAPADQLIRANRMRKVKRLFTSRPSGALPEIIEYYNEREEAHGLAAKIDNLRQEGYEYRQMAVFYRVNSLSLVLEEGLRAKRIPYQIVRGVEFFKRREIKDMVSYLRLLINPADQVSFKRIINRPTRGIGDTTVKRLFEHSAQTGKDIRQIINNVGEVSTLGAAARKRVLQFAQLIDKLEGKLNEPTAQILREVYKQSKLKRELKADKNEEPNENVEALIDDAARYDAESENPSLAEYLQQIALMSDADAYDEEAGVVSLMTLHAAKGLEFSVVFIIGVEDGLIPHARSIDNDKGLEEERRLLFVGMTRAQERLFFSYACNRTIHGASMATIRSEFVRRLEGINSQTALPEDDDDDSDTQDYDSFGDDDEDNTETPSYSLGQLVRHPKFGVGRVRELVSRGENSTVTIQFTTGSQKTLVLKYAKLEKL